MAIFSVITAVVKADAATEMTTAAVNPKRLLKRAAFLYLAENF